VGGGKKERNGGEKNISRTIRWREGGARKKRRGGLKRTNLELLAEKQKGPFQRGVGGIFTPEGGERRRKI